MPFLAACTWLEGSRALGREVGSWAWAQGLYGRLPAGPPQRPPCPDQAEYGAPPPRGLAHAVGASHPCVTEHTRAGSWAGTWGGGGRDSRPGSAGRPSSWAGGCRRWSWWARAASAASPAARPAPGGSWVARHPGPSTTGRCGCRQRVAVRAVLRLWPAQPGSQPQPLCPGPQVPAAGCRAEPWQDGWVRWGRGARAGAWTAAEVGLAALARVLESSLFQAPLIPMADSVTLHDAQVQSGQV